MYVHRSLLSSARCVAWQASGLLLLLVCPGGSKVKCVPLPIRRRQLDNAEERAREDVGNWSEEGRRRRSKKKSQVLQVGIEQSSCGCQRVKVSLYLSSGDLAQSVFKSHRSSCRYSEENHLSHSTLISRSKYPVLLPALFVVELIRALFFRLEKRWQQQQLLVLFFFFFCSCENMDSGESVQLV